MPLVTRETVRDFSLSFSTLSNKEAVYVTADVSSCFFLVTKPLTACRKKMTSIESLRDVSQKKILLVHHFAGTVLTTGTMVLPLFQCGLDESRWSYD